MRYFVSFAYNERNGVIAVGNCTIQFDEEITVRNFDKLQREVEYYVWNKFGFDWDIKLIVLNFIRID